jgi:hypothetical protein
MRNPVKLPCVGNALENMCTEILERDAGAGHKILDCARDDDVVGTPETCDPRSDVHGDAPYVVVRNFDFAGVNAGANRNFEGRSAVMMDCAQ